MQQFRRNEAKRASMISQASSLVSSDGTINVVTDSDDDGGEDPATPSGPSPGGGSALAASSRLSPGSTPTDNGLVIGPSPSGSPRRRLDDSASAAQPPPPQTSKCSRSSYIRGQPCGVLQGPTSNLRGSRLP